MIGLEPITCWLQISCSANWATSARILSTTYFMLLILLPKYIPRIQICQYFISLYSWMTPTGIEPVLPPWKGDVLTAWPRSRSMIRRNTNYDLPDKKTPRVGLEPTTARLTAACSTDWAIEEYIRYIPWKPHTLYHIFLIFASTFFKVKLSTD